MCESVFKVLIIGDMSVGKTSMVARYCHNRWLPNYKATLGGKAEASDRRAVCIRLQCARIQGSGAVSEIASQRGSPYRTPELLCARSSASFF